MTPNEFKAWLRGIDTVLGGASPNAELWKLIREAAEKMVVPQPFVMPPAPSPAIFRDPPQLWLSDKTPPFAPPYDTVCGTVQNPLVSTLGEAKGDRDAR